MQKALIVFHTRDACSLSLEDGGEDMCQHGTLDGRGRTKPRWLCPDLLLSTRAHDTMLAAPRYARSRHLCLSIMREPLIEDGNP